jgi:hypothetical protein
MGIRQRRALRTSRTLPPDGIPTAAHTGIREVPDFDERKLAINDASENLELRVRYSPPS